MSQIPLLIRRLGSSNLTTVTFVGKQTSHIPHPPNNTKYKENRKKALPDKLFKATQKHFSEGKTAPQVGSKSCPPKWP